MNQQGTTFDSAHTTFKQNYPEKTITLYLQLEEGFFSF